MLHDWTSGKRCNDRIEFMRNSGRTEQSGNQLGRSVFPFDDVDVANRVVCRFQLRLQVLARLLGMLGRNRKPNLINGLGRALLYWSPIDRIHERSQERITYQYEASQRHRFSGQIGSGTCANRCRTP